MPSIAIWTVLARCSRDRLGRDCLILRDRLFQRAPFAPRKASRRHFEHHHVSAPLLARPHRIDPCEVAVEGDARPRLLGVEGTKRRGRGAPDRLIHFAEDPPGKERFEGIGQVRNSRTRRQPPRHAGYGTGQESWSVARRRGDAERSWRVATRVRRQAPPTRRDSDRITAAMLSRTGDAATASPELAIDPPPRGTNTSGQGKPDLAGGLLNGSVSVL